MTKTQAISGMILNEVANGADLKSAMDKILGEGSYEKLAGEVYEQLQGE